LKKKRIIILHSSNDLYGASKVLVQLIEILIDIGFEINLILPYKGPLDSLLNNKVKISHKNLGVFRKKYLNFFGVFNRIIKILNAIFFLNKIIKKNKIEFVYTNTSVIIAGGIIAKIHGLKSYFHIHEIPKNNFYSLIISHIINICSDKIIVVSNAVKDHWIRLRSENVYKIYNGINFKTKKNVKFKKNNQITFTNIGRLIPYKGHIYFIKIAKELLRKNSNLKFYIVGDTFKGYEHYERELKDLVKCYRLQKKIIFTGYQNDISKYLLKSNFFLHTTIEPDPLPTVIFEAILSKTPIIATNHGGVVEIIDFGKGGLLIPYNDHIQAGNLIEKYLLNKRLIKQQREYALDFTIKNFSYENFKKNIIKLFKP
jgi:glycosyltransferase involved in cell wall biosynthesis